MRPSLLGLLALTAVLFTWQLSSSGTANSFYAAAVQAGTKSWKAWFFGSLDSANSITVDKPPAALWIMGLSARVFGFNSWSLLLPQAAEGVAAVAVLFAAVRRVAGPVAGLVAGAALALTPAAVLIFRFDNPDALLVLLVVAAAYCVTRALEGARSRWMLAAGLAIGFGFLTKSGQALLPVPALGLAYLLAAPTGAWRRVRQLLLAAAGIVVGAGWWLAVVALWPTADRPYIGGSTDNDPLELAFGYNGLGRLLGGSGNSSGGGSSSSSFGGATGLGRLFRGEFGLEISWLLPAALVVLVAGLWLTARRPRTDATRAALVIWGGTLLTTALTFSFMKGTIHPYYTVALAAPIAAVLAIGGRLLWARADALGRLVLALAVAATGSWGAVLLHRNADLPSWVLVVTVALTAAATVALVLAALPRTRGRRFLAATALAAVLAVGVPSGAWAVATSGTAHSGSIPTAVSTSTGAGSGSSGGSSSSSSTSAALTKALTASTTTWSAATVGSQGAAELELASGTAVMAIGGWSGTDASPTLAQFKADVAAGKIHYFVASTTGGGAQGGSSHAAPTGTKPSGTKPSGTKPSGTKPSGTAASSTSSGTAASSTSTSTSTTSSGSASTSKSTTGSAGTGDAAAITAWVKAHYTATTLGGTTVYDLTTAAS